MNQTRHLAVILLRRLLELLCVDHIPNWSTWPLSCAICLRPLEDAANQPATRSYGGVRVSD